MTEKDDCRRTALVRAMRAQWPSPTPGRRRPIASREQERLEALRQRFEQVVLGDLLADWERHGLAVLVQMRR
jgi:hypothetical protein